MAFVLLGALAFAVVINLFYAFRRGADDRGWEASWERLDELDRAWLEVASRSRVNRHQLEERGELELAKGCSRREMRRRGRLALAVLPPFFIVAILMLTGVFDDHAAAFVFALSGFIPAVVFYLRERKAKARYRETQARYLAGAGAATTH
jgi:hypothetical protein